MFGVSSMVSDWVLASDACANRPPRCDCRSVRGGDGRRTFRIGESRSARTGAGRIVLRAALFPVVIGFLLFGLSLVRTYASEEAPAAPKAGERIVYADEGDSLWKIAASVKRESLDTRAAVHAIMKRNGLAEANLGIGQKLIIPAHILPSAEAGAGSP